MKKILTYIGAITLAFLLFFIFFNKKSNVLIEDALVQNVDNQYFKHENKKENITAYTAKPQPYPLSKKAIFNSKNEEIEGFEELEEDEKIPKKQRIKEALEYENYITQDPALGYVPLERKQIALEQTLRMQARMVAQSTSLRGAVARGRWVERGPGNVGGRTRAIWVDLNDPTRQTVWAAGVTGGLYKITNIASATAKWEKINDWMENLTVSSIAQDPTNPANIYVGTGDCAAGDNRGNGIYKSSDGGKTWQRLASTVGTRFSTVSSIDVDKKGRVFAATFTGLYKSSDEGENWQKVLGTGSAFGNASNNMWRVIATYNDVIYVATHNEVYKSEDNGNAGSWQNLSGSETGYPSGWSRTELAVAPSDPNVLYIVGSLRGVGTNVYQSTDGGKTWRQRPKPAWRDGGAPPSTADFTRGQAWYDLSLVVSPNDPYTVFLGGVDCFRSQDGGQSWQQITSWTGTGFPYVHADHHGAIFEPNNPNVLYLGTDGGVFRVDNASGTPRFTEKTNNFVTTQFYGCAIHPDSLTNYFIAGAQDNGTIVAKASGVDFNARKALGGDGFLCFINQNIPNIQIGSLYYGDWRLSKNGGSSFSNGARSNGRFYCPADYDDTNNILYAQTNNGDLWRWSVAFDFGQIIDLEGINTSNASVIYVDPNDPTTVYVGTNQSNSGFIAKVEDANKASGTAKANIIGNFSGNVSCIDIEKGNSKHILVTLSNYGVKSVFETTDGGQLWYSLEGNLPDMPVRWGIFNPNNNKQAIIATELGVWSTELINGENTIWNPPFPTRGTPLVRTDMLQMRQSDNMVLAATYGRGMWTSTMFSKAKAAFETNGVGYVNIPFQLRGDASNAAETFNWNFGDGTTDSIENPSKTFKKIGTYDVALTINGNNDLSIKKAVKILPKLNLPYQVGASNYDGSFETADNDFGAYSVNGSKFERAKSNVAGKDGVKTGKFAYVLAPNDREYAKNTEAYLYTPMFDMSQKGIYQFSFWAYFDIQKGYDGMRVEYSTDKGNTWSPLGSASDANWYNYNNTTVSVGAFPLGTAYFSGTLDDWTRFKINISQFAGQSDVAFRFAFKSDEQTIIGSDIGIAIDDIQVLKYDGILKTNITEQNGQFAFSTNNAFIDVKFKTQPEYYAKTFEIEMSENGITTKETIKVNATGIVSAEQQDYSVRFTNTTKDIYFFRIKSINEDSAKTTFYTDRFVVKKDNNGKIATLNQTFPSPFIDNLYVSFTDFIKDKVTFELFAVNGQKVYEETKELDDVYYQLKLPRLAKGMYVLTVKIGSNKAETVKVYGGF